MRVCAGMWAQARRAVRAYLYGVAGGLHRQFERTARAIFGDHIKPSTAERMVPRVSDGESAKWPRQRREDEASRPAYDG